MSGVDGDAITRRRLLEAGGASAASLAALGALGPRALAAPAAAQNVIVIVLDNVRSDHVGAYGGQRVRTPAIDGLARESLRFSRYRPEVFPTIPARRSIMTGRRVYPFRGWRPEPGLPQEPGWESIDRRIPVFTDVLGNAGWHTGYVTDNPHILSGAYDGFRARFDQPVIVKGQVPYRGRPPGRPVDRRTVNRHLLPKLRGTPTQRRIREYLTANKGREEEADYLSPRVFTEAARWVEGAVARQTPFALVVDSFDPHEPWDPAPRYLRRFGPGRIGAVKPIQAFAPPGGALEQFNLSRAAMRRVRNLYAAELAMVDTWLGLFLGRLEQLGLMQNTLIVLLSDHGVLLGERGEVGKTEDQMHREITRVPLLIRDPAGRGAGRTSDYFASTHDIAPTVLSMLGRPVPRAMDGVDLSVLLRGRAPPRRRIFTASYGRWVSAGDGRWLLICDNRGAKKRLYDTRRDPGERRNVASRHPAVVRRLWRQVIADAGGRRLPRF